MLWIGKCCFISVVIGSLFLNCAHGDDLEEADNARLHELIQEPLFVSLGSVCEIAHALRACNLRKAAFPFDWITSIDSEKFLEILEQNFRFFLDENFLSVGDSGSGPLLNTHYHLEILHEGDFRGDLYLPNMETLQSKYQRRVERFRQLGEFRGKVFFLRSAYQYSTTDPHRYYYCADNLEINDEYTWTLYSLLQKIFPNLDFTLIIINNDNGIDVHEEKRLSNNIIKIRSGQFLEISEKWDAYRTYFNSVIEENTRLKASKAS